ncbi:unnamed protein product [Prorocentrum cordatum]|uniref:Uncharacterized protein n=1 Tax=Prorocentrum cordatum TaxID=2364126 RepID=A0ABN9TGQ2_9DINO|nr:unnamed protein product [Polarella glacialis]
MPPGAPGSSVPKGCGKGAKGKGKGKDKSGHKDDNADLHSNMGGSAMNVKTEGPPSAKAPRRPGAAGAASASTASPAGKTAPSRAAEPRPYLTNSGVDAYMDELTEAPSKCGRNDCPNTLAKAGDNEEFRCKEWGNYSFEWKKVGKEWREVYFPAGPACWLCGPVCNTFAFVGNPAAVIDKCNEDPSFAEVFVAAVRSSQHRAFFYSSDVYRNQSHFTRASKRKRGLTAAEFEDLGLQPVSNS